MCKKEYNIKCKKKCKIVSEWEYKREHIIKTYNLQIYYSQKKTLSKNVFILLETQYPKTVKKIIEKNLWKYFFK